MVPCLSIGGDFYDYVDLDGSLGFVLGDVSGKGAAAGLLGARVQEIFAHRAPKVQYHNIWPLQNSNRPCTIQRHGNEAPIFSGSIVVRSILGAHVEISSAGRGIAVSIVRRISMRASRD